LLFIRPESGKTQESGTDLGVESQRNELSQGFLAHRELRAGRNCSTIELSIAHHYWR